MPASATPDQVSTADNEIVTIATMHRDRGEDPLRGSPVCTSNLLKGGESNHGPHRPRPHSTTSVIASAITECPSSAAHSDHIDERVLHRAGRELGFALTHAG